MLEKKLELVRLYVDPEGWRTLDAIVFTGELRKMGDRGEGDEDVKGSASFVIEQDQLKLC